MNIPYKFNSQEDIYKLSELACQEDFNIYISTNTGMLNAKSLLALFTILGKDINLVAPDHADSKKFIKFIEKLSKN
jgi:hypothetical protein